MRVKPVPAPPEDVETLETILDAVPLVPEPETSCCDRLVDRTAIEDADAAREWLAFLRGLGLVSKRSSGHHRTRERPDDLAATLIDGVYGAREIRDVLASAGPLSAEAAFERFEAVPRWERHRNPDWEATWRERVERLLEWLALFDRAKAVDGGYALRDLETG